MRPAAVIRPSSFFRLLRLASAAEEAEAKQEEQSFKSVCFHRDKLYV